jgi:uncharacterized metal-binding protein
MPDAATHDRITLISGVALAPLVYGGLTVGAADAAALGTSLFTIAHMVSGVLFSPDLDIDSAIHRRWGILSWIWRPYMWIIPHRHFWSHSLVVAPLLKLIYFYGVLVGTFLGASWCLAQLGVVVRDYHVIMTRAIIEGIADNPHQAGLLIGGFITGNAAHTIADWASTTGKRLWRRWQR